MQRRKSSILGLYDAPLWTDWIFYLTVVALIAGWRGTTGVIDIAFALGFQFALFGVIPCAIRKAVRNRRSRSVVSP